MHMLQQRLVYESGERDGPAVSLLLCEHRPLITVGRMGSRAHVRISEQELVTRQIGLQWVNRGGGCIFHAPGQLAVCPVVSLTRLGWSVGGYMERIRVAIERALQDLGVAVWSPPGQFGVWGRTGLLAACAVGVHYGVACHGYYINVHPPMGIVRRVDTVYQPPVPRDTRRWMSSLLSERGEALRMTRVRSAVVEAFATALERPRFHLQTGHTYLSSCCEQAARAS